MGRQALWGRGVAASEAHQLGMRRPPSLQE